MSVMIQWFYATSQRLQSILV